MPHTRRPFTPCDEHMETVLASLPNRSCNAVRRTRIPSDAHGFQGGEREVRLDAGFFDVVGIHGWMMGRGEKDG